MPRSQRLHTQSPLRDPIADDTLASTMSAQIPVMVLFSLAIGVTIAWGKSNAQLAYLQASESVQSNLVDGLWVTAGSATSPGRALAFGRAERETPQRTARWVALISMAGIAGMALTALQRRKNGIFARAGHPVPLQPSLA